MIVKSWGKVLEWVAGFKWLGILRRVTVAGGWPTEGKPVVANNEVFASVWEDKIQTSDEVTKVSHNIPCHSVWWHFCVDALFHEISQGISMKNSPLWVGTWWLTELVVVMEAGGSSETLVSFYQTTWCNVLEDSHLHTHCHENLKSHLITQKTTTWTYCIYV
jgi:hypothetical protein